MTHLILIKKTICLLIIGLFALSTMAQELPPVRNFEPSAYKADNQNWQATQGDDGVVYFANNKGLLSYNGAQWHLDLSPNETIVRSVNIINDRIYTGAHMDFGFWQKQNDGTRLYTSLKDTLQVNMLEGEQIWKILDYKDKILFQSLNGVYVYNPENNKIDYIPIATKNAIFRLFEIDGDLYFQPEGKGLFSIEDGKAVLYDDRDIFLTKTFIAIYKKNEFWLGVTQKDGIYKITPASISPWVHPAADFLQGKTLYRASVLSDESLALGTIAHGFIKLTKEGAVDYQMTQERGLGNNTVLSILEDTSSNIWLGLDNGIACINTTAPVQTFFDQQGLLGTTYVSQMTDAGLYLGTNQGLFFKENYSEDFALVPGTEEQVWTLRMIDETLFCGHNKGTYIIKNGKAQKIGNVPGTWTLLAVPERPDLIIQGNYDGLYVLQKNEGTWSVRNKIAGFDISSRYFEFASANKIIVSNEYKGVYEVEVDSAFAKAISFSLNPSVSKGEHASLVSFENTIYYANKSGIYRYDLIKGEFIRDPKMSAVFDKEFVSGKLVNDQSGKLWAFVESGVVYFSKDALDNELSVDRIHIPKNLRGTAQGFENIEMLSSDEYLIGTTNGYITISPPFATADHQIHINEVLHKEIDGDFKKANLSAEGIFQWRDNNIIFKYHVAQFDKFKQTEYQYRLKGFYDKWSNWSPSSVQEFTIIPPGAYTFEVRARVGDTLTTNTTQYSFEIAKPWFTSTVAILIYVLLALLALLLLQLYNRKRYKIKRDRLLERTKREMDLKALAIEKENIELRNQNLRDDIQARNRELATSTLAMVNKSKTLKSIKEKLSKIEPSSELDLIIKDIDKYLSSNDDWEFFEKAFNHADKDFFKRVKEIHPELTTNDLKLCVYLRLNLSSKEIAPLLNISPRSVEIKRYRLRKKINLDRSRQLNDYFIHL